MKIAHVYISFDNKVFDTEKACKEYENKQRVFFYDISGAPIEFKRTSHPVFILLPTADSVKYFKMKIEEWTEEVDDEEYCYDDFSFPGVYIYVNDSHYYHYDSTEINIAKTLLKEAGI